MPDLEKETWIPIDYQLYKLISTLLSYVNNNTYSYFSKLLIITSRISGRGNVFGPVSRSLEAITFGRFLYWNIDIVEYRSGMIYIHQ